MNRQLRERCRRLGIDPDGLDIEIDIDIDVSVEPEVSQLLLVLLLALNRKVDRLMANIEALDAAVTQLGEAQGLAVAELQELRDEIAELEAGEISQEKIDALTEKVTGVATTLTAAAQDPAQPGANTPPVEEPGAETPPAAEPPLEDAAPEPPAEGAPPAEPAPGAEPPAEPAPGEPAPPAQEPPAEPVQ